MPDNAHNIPSPQDADFRDNYFYQFRKKEKEDIKNAKGILRSITGFIGFTSFAGLMTAGITTGFELGSTMFAAVAGIPGGTFAAIVGGLIAAAVCCAVLAFVYFKAAKWIYKLFRRITQGNETYRYLRSQCKENSKKEITKMIKIVAELKELRDKGIDLELTPGVDAGLAPVQAEIFRLICRYFKHRPTDDGAVRRFLASGGVVKLRKKRTKEMLKRLRAEKAIAQLTYAQQPANLPDELDDGLGPGRSPWAPFSKIRDWFAPKKSLKQRGARMPRIPLRRAGTLLRTPHHLINDSSYLAISLLELLSDKQISGQDQAPGLATRCLEYDDNLRVQTPEDVRQEIQTQTRIEQRAHSDDQKQQAQAEINYLGNIYAQLISWHYQPRDIETSPTDAAAAAATPAPTTAPTNASDYPRESTKTWKTIPDMSPAQLMALRDRLAAEQASNTLSKAEIREKQHEVKRVEYLLSCEGEGSAAALRA